MNTPAGRAQALRGSVDKSGRAGALGGTFTKAVERFATLAEERATAAMQIAAREMYNSTTVGSAVTGSQGTPVAEGYAQNSWECNGVDMRGGAANIVASIRPGEERTVVGRATYLRGLEEGRARQRPAHWVRLSILAWPRIVQWAVAQVQR